MVSELILQSDCVRNWYPRVSKEAIRLGNGAPRRDADANDRNVVNTRVGWVLVHNSRPHGWDQPVIILQQWPVTAVLGDPLLEQRTNTPSAATGVRTETSELRLQGDSPVLQRGHRETCLSSTTYSWARRDSWRAWHRKGAVWSCTKLRQYRFKKFRQ